MKKIDENIKRLTHRLRIARALRGSAFGALAGAFTATALALLDSTGAYYTSWEMLAVSFVGAAAMGSAIGYFLKVNRMDLADSADRRLGLRNRLRTSLESTGESDFDRAVILDTEQRLGEVRNMNAFPLRLSRWHACALLAMALASAIFMLGNTPLFLNDAEKLEREELKVAAEQIRRVSKPLLENNENAATEERELAERLEKLAKELEKGRMSKKDALAKANELSDAAEKLAKNRNAEASKTIAEAEALRKQAEKQRLEAAGLGEADMSQVEQSHAELDRQSQSLQRQIADLEDRLAQEGLSQEERDALESQLNDAKENLQNIELSKKAKDFLERLQSHPAYEELLEMASKIRKSASEGGDRQLTEEQIKEMIKRLEELADQLKDEEDLKAFIEALKKSLKECEGAYAGLGAGMCLAGILPGKGGRSQDNFFLDTDRVNKTETEQDIKASVRERAVRGERAEQGTETHIEISGPAAAGERTKTPYTNLLPKYKKSAESAINRQQIPKSQQKRVREYFESLSGGK